MSGVGDDANPCSRTAPCRTFAGAISRTAIGGEISALDPGSYGAVTITKSITINGTGTQASVLASGSSGIVINTAGEPDSVVILRDLQINGAGGTGVDGVRFVSGGSLHVEDCHIFGFAGQGVNFQPSGNSSLHISRTTLRDNFGGGVYVVPAGTGTATAMLDDVRTQGNGRGVRVEDGATVTIRNSSAWGNANNGFLVVASARAAIMNLEHSVSAHNGASGVYSGGASGQVRLANSLIVSNGGYGLESVSGAITSYGGNRA